MKMSRLLVIIANGGSRFFWKHSYYANSRLCHNAQDSYVFTQIMSALLQGHTHTLKSNKKVA